MSVNDPIDRLRRSGQTLTGDSLGSAITFNAQCFLIQNMFNLAPKAEATLTRTHTRAGPGGPVPAMANRPNGVYVERARGAGEQQCLQNNNFHAGSAPGCLSGYTWVAPVLSDRTIPPAESYSKLTQTSIDPRDRTPALLDLTTDKMAMLVPRLRLYKVEYDSLEPDADGFRRPNLDSATDIEIIFDDFIRGASLEKMFLERKGRLSGTGIKSFKWTLKGVNPADIDKNIEAELVIHFNDVSDLFTDQRRNSQYKSGHPGSASFLDLIIYAPHRSKVTEGGEIILSDNTVEDPDGEVTPNYLLYNGKFFEIKAEVGWQVPTNPAAHFSPGQIDAVRKSQVPLYLQLTQHKFSFKQDGSADLVINYRARYSNLEERFDIFGIPENLGINKELESLEKERSALDKLETTGNAKQQKRLKKQRGLIDAEIKKGEKALNDYLKSRYSRILTQLIDSECLLSVDATPMQLRAFLTGSGGQPEFMNAGQYDSMMRRLRENPGGGTTLPPNAAVAGGAGGSADFIKVMTGTQGRFGQFMNKGFFDDPGPVRKYLGSHTEEASIIEARISEALDEDNKGEFETGLAAGGMRTLGPTRGQRGSVPVRKDRFNRGQRGRQVPKIPIAFFLLGDLLDVIIGSCADDTGAPRGYHEELKKGRAGFITTDIEFLDLEKFYKKATQYDHDQDPSTADADAERFFKKLKFKELSFSKSDKNTLYKPINIASIPINYEFFVEWYMQKVVKPKRQKYFFNHFLRDLLTDLVAPALSGRCFPGIPSTNYHVTQLDFLADKDSDFAKALYPNPTFSQTGTNHISHLTWWPSRTNPALPAKITVDKRRENDNDFGHATGADVHRNFKTIVMTTPSMLGFEDGDYESDTERGVYHFIVGANSGLLKSATFERVDAPYLRESRISRDRVAGAEQLRELYNVTLKLYGAPLIKPGQYVYVLPAPIGFGNPRDKRSISRLIGIGGYHLVTEVTNTVTAKGYETTVKALHQAMPYLEGTEGIGF